MIIGGLTNGTLCSTVAITILNAHFLSNLEIFFTTFLGRCSRFAIWLIATIAIRPMVLKTVISVLTAVTGKIVCMELLLETLRILLISTPLYLAN